jgi:hypothetical protein
MSGAHAPTVHQLKIGLEGAAPPLWRRLQLPSAASLGFLHSVIQEAFGWEGFHLHRFRDERGREWGESDFWDGGGYGAATFADEEEAGLGKVLRAEGSVLWYVYDFGDDWRHRIEVEKILPLDSDVTYPRCTGGRRAASPAEDIGGIWGLEEVAYLVTHPEADPPEHFEDLICDLRDRGFDPGAFDPADLTRRLSGLNVRTAAGADKPVRAARAATDAKPARAGTGTRRGVKRRSVVGGGDRIAVAPAEAEVFAVITLPPRADLAVQARRTPLFGDALRLAQWCAPGRPVTGKGVLKPAVAREAVEELRLWQHDDTLTDPSARANALAGLRSAGDLSVLDVPWRFASGNGLIAIRSGKAFPGPDLPDDDDQLLSCWQDALEVEVGALDDLGARVMPGMLNMLAESFASVVFPVLKLLYRLPDEEWLDADGLLSSLGSGAAPPDTSLLDVFVMESTAQLVNIFAGFGAADVDWGATPWRADYTAISMLLGDSSFALPSFRMRLTPLGRQGIRNILVSAGHTARVAGELATADATTLLDALPHCDPAAFSAELTGWLADRDEASAVSQLLEAIPGTEPDLAGRRVSAISAISALTVAKPGDALEILRDAAVSGPDGRRHVAAGVLANLGEESSFYREAGRQWLLIDLLTALSTGDLRESLSQELLETIGAQADDLWRSDHPATADTMEATAAALRDSDKTLAKRLRRSAHKARGRSRSA